MAPYATPPDATGHPARVTVPTLSAMARDGIRIAMLTAYDASFAARATAPASTCCSSAIRSAW